MSGRQVLVIDVGGNNIKLRCTGIDERRKTPSGRALTPEAMVEKVRELVADWHFDAITIGCPGPVRNDRITLEPVNLAAGWVGFDFQAAFGKPTRLINDAAMQALGSYEGGKMLFLGLGTGLGAALVVDDLVLPLEVAHLPYKKGTTFEDHVGNRGLVRLGPKRWEKAVHDVTARLEAALVADHVVLGGGNAKKLKKLPPGSRLGDNENAFKGGFRLWEGAHLPA
ncbi:MAG TPA: ROK family protein [Geminicoccaceae bacterium]|nr:ROK family protein [Geminicoccaceae bacterium]